MSGGLYAVSESSLQFFGAMTASISHEINNVLAIINENAGLLEDFTLMADKGVPIDPERLKTLAGKIMTQIRRADKIIKKMNKFAHSVDGPIKRVNLGDLIELVVALSNRFASMRGITLEVKHPPNPVIITTNVFFLENLLWLCLDLAMDVTGPDKKVTLSVETAGIGGVIRFSGLEDAHGRMSNIAGNDGLLGALKGKLDIDLETRDISVTLPSDINN
ncbi:MAG: histidine kinase dimerization/phospho-acceptor domain-containing protein [Thermodesulfobacteriota bacterium]|nr:histidine kinase dimerization/phospho-acceptor domain-containing protein [Thermodesulfobacteriota bacterium]